MCGCVCVCVLEGGQRGSTFRNICCLFSLSLAAMGMKTLHLFCAHALAVSTFSSLELKVRQDKQNPVVMSHLLSDRSRICFISLGYGRLSNVQLLYINDNLTIYCVTIDLPDLDSNKLQLDDLRLFHALLITQSIIFLLV